MDRETKPPAPPSPQLIAACHRAGIAAAIVWWVYAFFATEFFMRIDAAGLLVYLVGVPVFYVLAYYLLRGIVWLFFVIR